MLGLLRRFSFIVQGDGVGNVIEINLREQIETAAVFEPGAASPTVINDIAITIAGGGIPPAPSILSSSVENWVLTVTFATPLPNGLNVGYSLNFGVICPGSA